MRIRFTTIAALAALIASTAAPAPGGGDAAPTDEIRLGMSTALSGPSATRGRQLRSGVQAAIDECNRAGGLDGRAVRLVSLDDAGEADRTVTNLERLIEIDRVVALIGTAGTPTATAAAPVANAGHTLFFGAHTGAPSLRRSPPDRYVVNVRASYAEEVAALVDALVVHAGLAPESIGFFTPDGATGDAAFTGGLDALTRHGLADTSAVAHARSARSAQAVESALALLLAAEPPVRAVIMVGRYAPCARFVQLAREFDFGEHLLHVPLDGAAPLASLLGPDGEGVVVTQVVPHYASEIAIAERYRTALEQWNGTYDPTFDSLEGYITARVLLHAIDTIEGEVTRDAIVSALEGLGRFDLGLGAPLTLGPADHQACDTVWPTVLREGRLTPCTWSDLGDGPLARTDRAAADRTEAHESGPADE